MSDYFSLLQNVTTEAGTFKTFSVFPAKRDYKYGFFCFGAEDKFVTLCAFNEKEDVDFVFGDSYSDLIATGVGERIRFVEYIWLRIW